MGISEWFSQNLFNILSAVGIIGGLWFTAISFYSEAKTRRIANLLAVTANYREVWREYLHNPKLTRVLDASADVVKHPITRDEELFVGLILSHINSVFYATNDKLVIEWEGFRRDVGAFFSLPIPKAVWSKTKLLQNQDFAAYIDSSLKN